MSLTLSLSDVLWLDYSYGFSGGMPRSEEAGGDILDNR
jgi:hypothetical protein